MTSHIVQHIHTHIYIPIHHFIHYTKADLKCRRIFFFSGFEDEKRMIAHRIEKAIAFVSMIMSIALFSFFFSHYFYLNRGYIFNITYVSFRHTKYIYKFRFFFITWHSKHIEDRKKLNEFWMRTRKKRQTTSRKRIKE